MTDYDQSELERIARELGYASWDAVPRIPKNQILGSIDDGITVADGDSWEALFTDLAETLEG